MPVLSSIISSASVKKKCISAFREVRFTLCVVLCISVFAGLPVFDAKAAPGAQKGSRQHESTMPVVTSGMGTWTPNSSGKAVTPIPAASSAAVKQPASTTSVAAKHSSSTTSASAKRPSLSAASSLAVSNASRPATVSSQASIARSTASSPLSVDIPASAIPQRPASQKNAKNSIQSFSRQAFVQPGELPVSQKNNLAAVSQAEGADVRNAAFSDDAEDGRQTLVSNERLTVVGSMPHHPESRFVVQPTPLPGGRHTRSSEEAGNAPEMTMAYKLNTTTSARVALNPQDQTSPLYSPIVKENGLTATGVYFDVNVEKNFQVQFGGEVRSYDSDSLSSSEDEETSTGASMGFRWSF